MFWPFVVHRHIAPDLEIHRAAVQRQAGADEAAARVLQGAGIEHLIEAGIDRFIQRFGQVSPAYRVRTAFRVREERYSV